MRESQDHEKISINWSMIISQALVSCAVVTVLVIILFLSRGYWMAPLVQEVLHHPDLQQKIAALEKVDAEINHHQNVSEGLDRILQDMIDLRDKLKAEAESGKVKDLKEDFFNFIENLKDQFKKFGKNIEKTTESVPEKEADSHEATHDHEKEPKEEPQPDFTNAPAGVESLQQAIQSGEPFVRALEEVLDGAGQDSPLVKLRPYAPKGVMTLAQLSTDLSTFLEDEAPEEKKGFLGFIHSFIRVESRERVKRIEILEEAAEDLNQEDIPSAITKIEGLGEKKYKSWLKKAQARVEVDKIMQSYMDGNVSGTI